MQWLQMVALGALVGMIAACVVVPPEAPPDRGPRVINCSAPHRLRIVDLNMAPDPVRQGQPIEAWRIAIQADYDGDCSTLLTVRDQNETAGRGQQQIIRPGRAVYTIPAVPAYRFQRQDACFYVQANVGGAWTPIEAQKTFCVRALPGNRWSLRDR